MLVFSRAVSGIETKLLWVLELLRVPELLPGSAVPCGVSVPPRREGRDGLLTEAIAQEC